MTDNLIAGRSLADWRTFSRTDTCLDLMVPSDLRALLDALEKAQAKLARMEAALVEHNDLMRSVFAIAEREGVKGMVASTNWDAFYNRVAVLLKKHHALCNEARAALQGEG